MNDKPIFLKIKDWVDLQMSTTPFMNACIGLGILVFAACYGSSLVLAALPWERLLP